MPNESSPPEAPELPPRVLRILEICYQVEGVASARVWQWDGTVAVGVRGLPTIAFSELIRRVEIALAPVREPGETWEFGLLEDG